MACIAAIVAVSYVTVDYVRDGELSGNPGETADRVPARVRFPEEDYRQSHFPRKGSGPHIGVNYTHYAFPDCSSTGTGIVANYHRSGVPAQVHRQLFDMRRNGLTALRMIIWHMTDVSGQPWGVISSAGGELREPNRTNFIRYLREVRKFGFARLTVALGPNWTNAPFPGAPEGRYDPAKFSENWRFLRSIRFVLKRYGPADTRIDLLNEGAPSDYIPDWAIEERRRYLSAMYSRYVKAFGNRDVTVSVIAPRVPRDKANRLQNLIHIIRSTGHPQPRWYEVHIGYGPRGARYGLRNSHSVLRRNHRRQPLVVGETAYDSQAVASAIKDFTDDSARPVEEVSPWYLRNSKGCKVSPPYSAGAYGSELVTQADHR
jgi:hypothetical protein